MILGLWESLGKKFGKGGRVGLVTGAFLIFTLTALLGFRLLRTEQETLFSQLLPQDAAVITAELEKQKIAYQLEEQESGTNILVDKNIVHKTRLKLMGKDLQLHGAVGFELFNNNDFGMTEFTQKINYQRALQGELTRTILSLNEIKDVRVLLAMPEQGLFRQSSSKAKASVTLTTRTGQSLRGEQVLGIQRLVAAAVPGIHYPDVTVLDQTGVALSRPSEGDAETGAFQAYHQLEAKQEIEKYLTRKAMGVLDRALGPGHAHASIDVTLDMKKMQCNTDQVLGDASDANGEPTGVVTRQRESTRGMDAPLAQVMTQVTAKSGAASGETPASSQVETDYAVGRKVEQVITQPGSIQNIQAAVVITKNTPEEQKKAIASMVTACIGASPERGDTVVVHAGFDAAVPEVSAKPGTDPVQTYASGLHQRTLDRSFNGKSPLVLLSCLILAALLFFVVRRPQKHAAVAAGKTTSVAMTEAERNAALAQIRQWLCPHESTGTAAKDRPSVGVEAP